MDTQGSTTLFSGGVLYPLSGTKVTLQVQVVPTEGDAAYCTFAGQPDPTVLVAEPAQCIGTGVCALPSGIASLDDVAQINIVGSVYEADGSTIASQSTLSWPELSVPTIGDFPAQKGITFVVNAGVGNFTMVCTDSDLKTTLMPMVGWVGNLEPVTSPAPTA